ncbi:unnamed protein product [Peniophora sp. CBMAI 1063]|nr:unnamed protein product [Peniophora sp. CBMAI 1063]
MNSKELANVVGQMGLIYVRDWAFCPHGYEFCHRCPTDQRAMNDGSIHQGNFSRDYRKGLSVVGRLVDTGRREGGNVIFNCKEHGSRDCEQCFNWKKLMKAADSKEEKGKINDRDQLLRLLESLNVALPRTTKLSTTALEKKLTSALDLVQNISLFSDKFPVDPSSLPSWKPEHTGSAYAEMGSMSIKEGILNKSGELAPTAFGNLRRTVMSITKLFEDGNDCVTLQDKDQQEVICLRIQGVHSIAKDTPLVTVVFGTSTTFEPFTKIENFIAGNLTRGVALAQIVCSVEEQAILRRLLYRNHSKLSADYAPELRPEEKDFKPSFLLPLTTLSQAQIGKLTHDLGCTVCGNPTTTKCSGCLSERYCGAACQKAHWKEHKAFCRFVRDGTWTTYTFSDSISFGGQKLFTTSLNFQSSVKSQTDKGSAKGAVPANIHEDKAFLVKLQRPMSEQVHFRFPIMVYDRNRSFQGHIAPEDNTNTWNTIVAQMPPSKLKIYRAISNIPLGLPPLEFML